MTRAAGLVWIASTISAVSFAGSLPVQESTKDAAQIVSGVLQTPENSLDLATAKLTFDKLIDPTIDIGASLTQINRMVGSIRSMAGPAASNKQKLTAVRDYIYVSGDWNDHRPYQYDLADPLGEKIANKLLPNYISSRRGNCVTMPFLFIILADRLGLNATASIAPLHVFVKLTDDATGRTFNLETTSGAHVTRDVWYREKMPMTDEAISNGVYMKALTKKETLAVMAETVVEHYQAAQQYERAMAVADVILAVYPNSVHTMLSRGTAAAHLLDGNFYQKYPTPNDIPFNLRREYETLAEINRSAFERAEALGWRPAE
ncbi:MAG: transglutaminase family protein [Steroidobacter sp.]